MPARVNDPQIMKGQGFMKNARQLAVRMAAALFMILVLCTAAAHRIEILLLTEVRAVTVPPAEKTEDGGALVKVPPASVFTSRNGEPCVMLLRRREGPWGMEQYVEETPVQVRSEDYDACFLEVNLEGQTLAVYPSRSLSDDETVRCVEE